MLEEIATRNFINYQTNNQFFHLHSFHGSGRRTLNSSHHIVLFVVAYCEATFYTTQNNK
jgi:hypothetical protein